jgi:hypothetical protein
MVAIGGMNILLILLTKRTYGCLMQGLTYLGGGKGDTTQSKATNIM